MYVFVSVHAWTYVTVCHWTEYRHIIKYFVVQHMHTTPHNFYSALFVGHAVYLNNKGSSFATVDFTMLLKVDRSNTEI